MLKKSLAWVLTLAMLLSTVSGLALFTLAEGEIFAYASYVSGQAMYLNATENLYTSQVVSTPMAEITKNEGDRNAAYMGHQNDQIGISIPAGTGMGSNVTVEVKFWANPNNQTETRLGMNYNTSSGMTDYAKVQMTGMAGAEIVTVDETPDKNNVAPAGTGVVTHDDKGWGLYTLNLTNADYNAGGQVNFVKWSWDNGANTDDGWYIASILVYDTDRGRPTEEQLYIRENTIGYIDFTAAEVVEGEVTGVDEELLSYSLNDKGTIVEFDGMSAVKITDNGSFNGLTVTALDVAQPAVKSTDTRVTVMYEAYVDTADHNDRFCVNSTGEDDSNMMYGKGHGSNVANGYEGYPYNPAEWFVMRFDITDNNTKEFKLGSWIGNAAAIYIRKVVVCRTELVSTNSYDNAFMDLDSPVAIYNDFQNVVTDSYNLTWSVSENSEDKVVDLVNGKTAVTCKDGYLYLNVADAFTKNGAASVADLGITVTYLDAGTGSVDLQYNATGEENYATVKVADKTDSGEWKTVTVYVADADLRNAQNGNNDMRIGLGGNTISAISIAIGADKAALNTWINKAINAAGYTADSVAAYNAAKAAAQVVADNVYATKLAVDTAVQNMSDAFDALVPTSDNRFDLIGGASWAFDQTQGSIEVIDGRFVWKYKSDGNPWMGIGDPDGTLANSTSVTYEYEILMETTSNNDRCFMAYGDDQAWHGVDEGGPLFGDDGYLLVNQDGVGNGFAAGGQWGATPAVGEWGTISITNAHYDPTKTSDMVAGAITALGCWMDDGELYVRSVKVYDTEDPSKMIALIFKEDVAELILTPGADSVVLTEKEGSQAYMIPGEGWLALNMDTTSLINQGTIMEGADDVVIEFEYWLDEWTEGANGNELLMIKHYNPDGNGENGDKTSVCEHQFNSSSEQLQKRGQWALAKFVLSDADFGAKNSANEAIFNFTYGNGSNIYIRGVKVYESNADGEMLSTKPAQWGSMLIDEDEVVFEVPTYDWNIDKGYQLKVSFGEGGTPTTFAEMNGYRAAIITDDLLYVNVDDEVIPETQKFICIAITHQNGASMHVEYGMVLPEGTDTSAEPNLSYYNFHSSNGIHEIVDGANVGQTSSEYSNPLGVIRAETDEHTNWTTTKIYLTDAQFRNSANGNDFRVRSFGGAVITKIEVYAIEESEIPVVGDTTALQALYDQLLEEYNYDFGDNTDLEDAFYAAEDFLEFQYRASQADIDTAVAALKKAIDDSAKTAGDVDGDNKITSTDARLVLQYYAKKITEKDLDLNVADVDGDGKITSTDARLILQLYAKKIDKLPIEG